MISVNPTDLLETSKPFDEPKVRCLEQLLDVVYNQTSNKVNLDWNVAHEIVSQLKQNPEAWRLVGTILQLSRDGNTQHFALAILEDCVTTRWNILPDEQKAGVKQYITAMAVSACTDPSLAGSRFIVMKINEVLVQIVKREWPSRWPSFIPDLCAAAKTHPAVCENSMRILSLLSEEIFDFGHESMTSKKAEALRASLHNEFQQIYDLCIFVMRNVAPIQFNSEASESAPTSISLAVATLGCLAHYLKWIPHEYILGTGLVTVLFEYFWEPAPCRIACLKCLVEVAALQDIPAEGRESLHNTFWKPLVARIAKLHSSTLRFDQQCPSSSRIFWEHFYCQLAICLTTFFRNHRETICEIGEGVEKYELVLTTLRFMAQMSVKVVHDETFKILLDFWHNLAQRLLLEVRQQSGIPLVPTKAIGSISSPSPLLLDDDTSTLACEPIENPAAFSERLRYYQPVLTDVRECLVLRMARPPEVCIHYDEETGMVDRDYVDDTNERSLYLLMRDTLVYLTSLGAAEMEKVLTEKLEKVTKIANSFHEESWNPTMLSRLCWAVGSISGVMGSERERRFLVATIKNLLHLCEHKRGKENKAVIASLIMYVFGQYPNFLRKHTRFLETVVSKLFEFMKETFEGVQDMACETYLKICQKCAKSLCNTPPENPLVNQIIPLLAKDIYTILQTPRQQLLLYEGTGNIIAAAPTLKAKQEYIERVMEPFNVQWNQLCLELTSRDLGCSKGLQQTHRLDPAIELHAARNFCEILRINERIASATAAAFSTQLVGLFEKMLGIYSRFSIRISEEVQLHGAKGLDSVHARALRNVKRAALKLISTFIESSLPPVKKSPGVPDAQATELGGYATLNSENSSHSQGVDHDTIRIQVVQFIVVPLLEPVLLDYKTGIPQARDSEVLRLVTTLITRLGPRILPQIAHVYDSVFDCTLEMIRSDFHSYLDHRTSFYEMLRASNDYCFEAIFSLPDLRKRYLVESLVWAVKHEHPAFSEQGLSILASLLENIRSTSPEILLSFCRSFYWIISEAILGVLTDTLHKSGFKFQAIILMNLIQMVETGVLNDPSIHLTKPDIMNRIASLLVQSFQNLNPKQIEAFVLGLFNKSSDPKDFTRLLKDFLIQLKEFVGSQDAEFELEVAEETKRAEELQRMRLRQVVVPGAPGAPLGHVQSQ